MLTSATSASRYHLARWALHDQPAVAQAARCVPQRAALAMESRLSKALQLSIAAGPCLQAASCSSRSPTSVCRREAASLQALLAVQHVSEPCALSLLHSAILAPLTLGKQLFALR